jgi:enterochelin esterase-like enzyme
MLEPQSTFFLVLLAVLFAALMWWLIVARRMLVRIVAACLAFIPAMTFGVAAVNRYYDYYQTWGAAFPDVTNQGPQAPPGATVSTAGNGSGLLAGHYVDIGLAQQQGYTLSLTVHGRLSNITRTVYVFLPPQYFWPGYQNYRFPAIELIHGFPGVPQDWITVLGVNSMLDNLVSQHRARPAVLVMPDANGGLGISLQCLNQVNGPQHATFLAGDLPAYIASGLRVEPPGSGWGIAGYSEGGFCAANLGLQDGRIFSYAGVLSGYFRPSGNQLTNPSRQLSPFGGNRHLAVINTPLDLLRSMSVGRAIARFWLGAGLQNGADVRNAEHFGQLLQLRQPDVTIRLVPGGGHTMATWRQSLPPMLGWMTQGLAQVVARPGLEGCASIL